MADTSRGGNIGGAEAVAFFSRSRLQVDTLKNIWTLADQPSTNSLDRKKFATAIRLIQLSQNGLKAQGANLGGPPGIRPAMFDGVSGVTVQLPPPEPSGSSVPGPGAVPPAPPQGQNPHLQITPQGSYSEPQPISSAPPSRTASFSAPPSPGGNLASTPPVMTTALATQDPYSLAPQEQSRYGDLFPNYAKDDGYIYGKEAVELFSKSGVPQDQLKQIWNMVDNPVDNRLDKLEFALAMHLIVCVSKKGLPLPNSLPVSLKALKSQATTSTEFEGAPQTISSDAEYSGVPPLTGQNHQFEQPGGGGAPSMNDSVGGAPQQQFSAPPPLPERRPTGMEISDAFEGLSPETASQGYSPPTVPGVTLTQEDTTNFSSNPMPSYAADERVAEPAPEIIPQPSPELSAPQQMPAPKPQTTEQLASSYDMGNDSVELSKLKATLQKLQAENIALKAQMGNMTEEEKEVKRETVATIEEITRLSSELTELRAQVLATKSRLLQSTAELTAAKEKKSALSDLITETRATNDVLQQAETDIQNVYTQAQAAPAQAPIPPPVAEADLFGGWDQPASTVNAPPPIPVANTEASAPTNDAQQMNVPSPFRSEAPAPTPMAENSAAWSAPTAATPAPMVAQLPANAPAAPIAETASYESEDNYGFGAAPLGSESSSLAPNNAAQAVPTQQFQEQMNLASSTMGAGEMAGGPVPPVAPAPQMAPTPPVENNMFGNGPPPIQSTLSADDIEDLKQAARRAEQTSQEAEETYRTLASEVEQLREIADQAEAASKEKLEKASKKKGLGKKKALKEADQAAEEAAEKKKHFLEMQAQASNAQALAMESKRETERLRDQAEQAELDFVASESTKYAQPNQNPPAPQQESQGYDQPTQNSHMQQANPPASQNVANPGVMSSYPNVAGGMPDPSQLSAYPNYGNGYNYQHTAPAPAANGVHQKRDSCDFGFGDGIMGGGGVAIPTPQNNDAYVNQF